MSTMNISLPDTMKAFVDEQVAERGYGTSSEYVRETDPQASKSTSTCANRSVLAPRRHLERPADAA